MLPRSALPQVPVPARRRIRATRRLPISRFENHPDRRRQRQLSRAVGRHPKPEIACESPRHHFARSRSNEATGGAHTWRRSGRDDERKRTNVLARIVAAANSRGVAERLRSYFPADAADVLFAAKQATVIVLDANDAQRAASLVTALTRLGCVAA